MHDTPPAKPPERGAVRVLVVYYSLTGNTEKMAEGVVEGAKRMWGVTVGLRKADEVSWDARPPVGERMALPGAPSVTIWGISSKREVGRDVA